jgi:hypothetical protein
LASPWMRCCSKPKLWSMRLIRSKALSMPPWRWSVTANRGYLPPEGLGWVGRYRRIADLEGGRGPTVGSGSTSAVGGRRHAGVYDFWTVVPPGQRRVGPGQQETPGASPWRLQVWGFYHIIGTPKRGRIFRRWSPPQTSPSASSTLIAAGDSGTSGRPLLSHCGLPESRRMPCSRCRLRTLSEAEFRKPHAPSWLGGSIAQTGESRTKTNLGMTRNRRLQR